MLTNPLYYDLCIKFQALLIINYPHKLRHDLVRGGQPGLGARPRSEAGAGLGVLVADRAGAGGGARRVLGVHVVHGVLAAAPRPARQVGLHRRRSGEGTRLRPAVTRPP